MNELGRLLFLAGLVLMLAGLVMWSGVGKNWLGRLPGDLHVSRGDVSLHLPVVTCLVISLVLTVVVWMFKK